MELEATPPRGFFEDLMPDDAEDIKRDLLKPREKSPPIKAKDLLSTGSTLLNLACTGRQSGGFVKGLCYRLIGDSSSGKTWFAMTCMAEATFNPQFSDYRFIFDDVENGALMDRERYFGKRLADRLEPPAGTRKKPVNSSTVEEFYYHVDDAVKGGRPFVYVLDSMDALDSKAELDKFAKDKTAHATGKEGTGSYGVTKAKENATKLRTVVNALRDSGSILVIISQAKDNIGFGSQFNPKTYSGGTALRFFAHVELWTSIRSKLKTKVRGKDRPVGAVVQIEVKKNRTEGWEGKVLVPFYKKHGIDDTGSCVDYLVGERHWKGKYDKQKAVAVDVTAPEFDFKGTREDLVQVIESGNKERHLRLIVQKVWKEIELKTQVKRKNRYD